MTPGEVGPCQVCGAEGVDSGPYSQWHRVLLCEPCLDGARGRTEADLELGGEAWHGPLAEVAADLAPQSEADPAALLVTMLAGFGVAIGRGPHVSISTTRHGGNLLVAIVGSTAHGAKGDSWRPIEELLIRADQGFTANCVEGGFASGEALIRRLAADGADHRRLVREAELSSVYARASRDGSIVSQTLRSAFDGSPLENRRVADDVVARNHHVGLVGHITPDELLRTLPAVEHANGFANRFLYVASRRSQLLPFGGDLSTERLDGLAGTVGGALEKAAKLDAPLGWSDQARSLWAGWSRTMTDRLVPGMLGALLARVRPVTLRLAVVYAAADGSPEIQRDHIAAAIAVWRYAEASALIIFGEATGDPMADRLLDALREAGEAGLSRDQQWDVIGSRNVSKERLDRARAALTTAGWAIEEERATGGRPTTVLLPSGMGEMGVMGGKDRFWASRSRLLSHNSHFSQPPERTEEASS